MTLQQWAFLRTGSLNHFGHYNKLLSKNPLRAWNEKHWIKPELIEQTELMQVKLVLHILNEGDTQSVPQDVPQDVPQTIIELIYNNPNITREDIAKQLGVSTKTIGRYLKKLENKVKFVGSGYSGHWEIIQK